MWGRAVWVLRGLFDVPAGLWPVPYDDHHHDHAPLQHLLRHGHRSVSRPVFDEFRLWTTTQRTVPARHGAAEYRRLSGKLPTMPNRGLGAPDDHPHDHALT